MTVAVVTPWAGHLELWPDYQHALAIGGEPVERIVVDNGSDPPLAFAAIRNPENTGFCHASNQGLHAATADIVVMLNNDVWASEVGWLNEIVEAVEPGVLTGPRLRTDPHTAVDGRVMPYLDGWCIAGTREDLLLLGGFDERLEEPAYYSDNLLCLEARAAGMALRETHAGVHHKGGVTAKPLANRDRDAAVRRNRDRYVARVRELFVPTSLDVVGAPV